MHSIKEKGKFLHLISITFILLLVSGCYSGATYFYPENLNEMKILKPEIGIISHVSLGEPIITSGYGREVRVLKVNRTLKFPHFPFNATITEGLYPLVYEDDNFEYYTPMDDHKMFFSNSSGEIFYTKAQLRLEKSNRVAFLSKKGTIWGLDFFSEHLDYTIIPTMFIEKIDSFQQTMLYLGKDKNNIRFSYREFSNNMIRDSFTTEITYDLSESTIIGFKSFKAEIIEATNTNLKYKIISSF